MHTSHIHRNNFPNNLRNLPHHPTPPSYLYKTVVPGNPLDDAKLLVETVGSLLRANALRPQSGPAVTFGQKAKEELEAKEKALA